MLLFLRCCFQVLLAPWRVVRLLDSLWKERFPSWFAAYLGAAAMYWVYQLRGGVLLSEEEVMVRVARTSLLAVGGVLAFGCTEEEAKVAVAEWKKGPDGCDACEARKLEVASRVMAVINRCEN